MTPVEEILLTGWPAWVQTVGYALMVASMLFASWALGRQPASASCRPGRRRQPKP